jgi:uncharacterized protein with HEPN domain
MKRDVGDYIEDIIDTINKAMNFVRDMDYETFSGDDKTIFAVIRACEIIGEAVKNIPDSIRVKHPALPWKDMAGMRDKVIHGYFGVKLKIVWNAVSNEFPMLKPEFEHIMDELENLNEEE